MASGDFHKASDFLDKTRFKKRPRYTLVLHEVREKLGISVSAYMVIDSIHKLSSTSPKYPYCTMSKEDMASFLNIGRATVFRALNEGLKKKLIERSLDHSTHMRATLKWIDAVELYDIRGKKGS